MGNEINLDEKYNYTLPNKTVASESYNTKIAMWQVPYNVALFDVFKRHDSDNSKWLETCNKNGENELEALGNELNKKLDGYKVQVQTTTYDDGSQKILSKYPNGTKTTEYFEDDYVFVNIKDKNNRTVAEKIFNYNSKEGHKTVYQNIKKNNNIFTIARMYSYDTSYNKKTDIVNFGYTNLPYALTNGCCLKKEYYMLNGEEVEVMAKDGEKYKVKDKNGHKFKFKAE